MTAVTQAALVVQIANMHILALWLPFDGPAGVVDVVKLHFVGTPIHTVRCMLATGRLLAQVPSQRNAGVRCERQ